MRHSRFLFISPYFQVSSTQPLTLKQLPIPRLLSLPRSDIMNLRVYSQLRGYPGLLVGAADTVVVRPYGEELARI